MSCPNCGAPTRYDRYRGLLVCDFCRGEFVPPVTPDGVEELGETDLSCPACRAALREGRIESVDVLFCASCRGMLICMGEFAGLIDTLRVYRDWPGAVLARPADDEIIPARPCPRCSVPMEHHPYGGGGNVFLDTCESCSVNWLDRGELQRIVAAPDPRVAWPAYAAEDDSM